MGMQEVISGYPEGYICHTLGLYRTLAHNVELFEVCLLGDGLG